MLIVSLICKICNPLASNLHGRAYAAQVRGPPMLRNHCRELSDEQRKIDLLVPIGRLRFGTRAHTEEQAKSKKRH